MINFHELAKKAHGGDKEALTVLIIESPKGLMGDMSPEAFAEKLSGDESACKDMGEMDFMSKEAYDPYAEYSEEHSGDEGPSDLQSDLQGLLDSWTERDPETDAGKYYQDLKVLFERQFGGSGEE
jgi:hypothetical protein